MRKIKKMMLGVVLAMGVFVGNVGSCYAVSSSISLDLTAKNLYGKFNYGEGGHQLRIKAVYQEKDPTGYTSDESVSATQFGSVTEVVVIKTASDGYQFTWGQAYGYVDGSLLAISGPVTVQ